MAKLNIPAVQLNNGMSVPALGYGTWLGINKDTMDVEMKDYDKMVAALSYAIDMGYRHIDTAHLYRVEPEVGAVVRQKIQEGRVKREDLFITTKVWNHYHRGSDVEVSARASLRRLCLTYVDLLLVHWPMSISQDGVDEKIDLLETWRGFESVLEKGLTRAIGVSNFNVDQLKRIVENCRVKPVCNQIEVNLTLGQNAIVDYCKSQNIAVVAYAPFGSMIPTRSAEGSPGPKLNDATMVAMAKKYGKTVTQVALRYLYQRGIVSIPKTVTNERVVENASIFDFSLSPQEVAAIAKFDVNYPTVRQPFWQNHSNYPYPPEVVPVPEIPLCLRKWMNGANLDVE